MIKRIRPILCCLVFGIAEAFGCTSALIGPEANPSGRPMLWKHRDTSAIDNIVEYVEGKNGEHSFVALFNADDKKLEQAWIGMNDKGFAIMNTASYNIKDDKVPQKNMDKEGYLMAKALKKCTTVEDFVIFLDSQPRPMGVEANFGVIDAYGNGAFFETNNHTYVRYDVKNAPGNVIVRTNYSHSGRPDEGFGFNREANACHLLDPHIKAANVTPELLTENISRSFWHDLKQHDYAKGPDRWVVDQDFIPRYKSTATVVIEGCRPISKDEKPKEQMIADQYIMWTGLGYPPCAEIVPVWCRENGVDEGLRRTGKNGHSPIGDRAKSRRDEVFPIKKGNGEKYIDIKKLYNEDGSGYVQTIVPKNLEVYKKTRQLRDR